jgi:precorrin-6A synthase
LLDGGCAFETLAPAGIAIWWGAYVGMTHETLIAGPLDQVAATIVAQRAKLRAEHGWIMDIYLLRRTHPASNAA